MIQKDGEPSDRGRHIIQQLDGDLSHDEKLLLLEQVRHEDPESNGQIDRYLLDTIKKLIRVVRETERVQKQIQELLTKYRFVPWVPAVFLQQVLTAKGSHALVLSGGQHRRVVEVDGEISLDSLLPGEEVFLSGDRNIILAKAPYGLPPGGEVGGFVRWLDRERLLLTWRDEEIILGVSGALQKTVLQEGDKIRFDRAGSMALEKLDETNQFHTSFQVLPNLGSPSIGGQEDNLTLLLDTLTARLISPDKAMEYGLAAQRGVLLVGPPGCGKTLLARIAASEIASRHGTQCRFAVVKPGEWESPWVGATQQNMRNCFAALRYAAKEGPAILFLDEVEAIGRIRGTGHDHLSDKFLAALLAEIDGFQGETGVAIIAATNRTDLIDPALLERISDVRIDVRRPTRDGARAIFNIHLPASLPLSTDPKISRMDLIEAGLSRLYSPNAPGSNLCQLYLRNGKTRGVHARELVSGRLLSQICQTVKQRGMLRDLRHRQRGICLHDMHVALDLALDRLRKMLTPKNVRSYLPDLTQDVDVVRVELLESHVSQRHRYIIEDPPRYEEGAA